MTISKGDRVLGLQHIASVSSFLWHGRVSNAVVVPQTNPASAVPTYEGSFQFDSVRQFGTARDLRMIADSLLRVRSYDNPERHFRPAYIAIDDNDFEAVVNGDVFIARTAVGAFLRQLPTAVTRRFVQHVVASLPEAMAGQSSMLDLWRLLAQFLRAELVAPAQLIRSTLSRARTINASRPRVHSTDGLSRGDPGAIPVAELAVETDSGPGNLAKQDQRLQAFLDLALPTSGDNLFDRIEQAIKSDATTQREFEHRFWGAPWPLPRTRF